MFRGTLRNNSQKILKKNSNNNKRTDNTNYGTFSPNKIIIASTESENDNTIIYYPKRRSNYINKKDLFPSTNSNQFNYKDKSKISEYIIKDNYKEKFITQGSRNLIKKKEEKKLEKSESTPYIKSYCIVNPFKKKERIPLYKENNQENENLNIELFSNVFLTNKNENDNLRAIKSFNELDSPSHLQNNNLINFDNYNNFASDNYNLENNNKYKKYNLDFNKNNFDNNNNSYNNSSENKNSNLDFNKNNFDNNNNLDYNSNNTDNNNSDKNNYNSNIISEDNNTEIMINSIPTLNKKINEVNNENNIINETPISKRSLIDDKSDFFTEMNLNEPNIHSPNIFVNNTNILSNEYCNCISFTEKDNKIQTPNSYYSNTTQSFYSTKGKKHLTKKEIYDICSKKIQSNFRGFISRKKFSKLINYYMNYNYAQIIFNNVLKRIYSRKFFNKLKELKNIKKENKINKSHLNYPTVYQRKKSVDKMILKKNNQTSFLSNPGTSSFKSDKIYQENLYYKNQIDDYIKKLEQLEKDNLILKKRNDSINKEKDEIEKNRNEIIIENKNLREKYKSLSIEKDQLNEKNNKMKNENLKIDEENKNLLAYNKEIKNVHDEVIKERNELKEEKNKILNEKIILEKDKKKIFDEYNNLNEKYNFLDNNIKIIQIENENLKEKNNLEENELIKNKELTKKCL